MKPRTLLSTGGPWCPHKLHPHEASSAKSLFLVEEATAKYQEDKIYGVFNFESN